MTDYAKSNFELLVCPHLYFLVEHAQSQPAKRSPINENIRFPESRLIGDDGAQLGIISPREALQIAEAKDLDLV